jgi:hypothetical protein
MIETIDKLKSKNFQAFGLHLLSAVTVIFLYNRYNTEKFASAKTYRYDIAAPADIGQCSTGSDEPGRCNVNINFTKPKEEFSINVIYGAIAFFLITAMAHIFYATDGFKTGAYSRAINAGWNPYRWAEYAISASIMTVITGLVQGVRDTSTLSSLAVATAAMQMCGLAVESNLKYSIAKVNKDSVYASTSAGWILFVGLWGVLVYNFANIVSDVKTKYGGQDPPIVVPSWIWIVVFSQLFYYATFGILQYVHLRERISSKNFSYRHIENWYINLSFFSKLSLAAGIGYGLIFRVKDCE